MTNRPRGRVCPNNSSLDENGSVEPCLAATKEREQQVTGYTRVLDLFAAGGNKEVTANLESGYQSGFEAWVERAKSAVWLLTRPMADLQGITKIPKGNHEDR